jgi:hypothetical protein
MTFHKRAFDFFDIITKAIYIYQAMTLTKDSVLWNGLPQSDNIASPTFSEKIEIH